METQALTRWHNERVLRSLRPGDLIEFPRTFLLSHWGVYLGNGDVCHVSGDAADVSAESGIWEALFSGSGVLNDKAKICIEKFWDIVGDSRACKNNDMDRKRRPLSTNEIIRRARQKVGEVGYNVFTKNCEHFANWCRYGEEKSEQAETGIGTLGGILGAIALAGVGYAIYKGASGSKQEEEDEEER